MKSPPMTVSEFARYSSAIPSDKHEDFNRMLSFVEDAVMGKCCRLICRDCSELGEPFLRGDGYWHHRVGMDYRCAAEPIVLGKEKV